MSKKLTAKAAHETIGHLFTKEARLNTQAFTITEQRHVLLGNMIYYRLRLMPEKGQEVLLDFPIETNAPVQVGVWEERT
jgi:hypothetical protein